jgi:hypothetical protein
MAKLKYDLSNVEDIPELEQAPVGTYRAKVVSAEGKESSKGNQMVEVRFHLTHDASGKKLKTEFSDIWEYPILDHDHPFVQNKTKEFLTAFGMKLKGTWTPTRSSASPSRSSSSPTPTRTASTGRASASSCPSPSPTRRSPRTSRGRGRRGASDDEEPWTSTQLDRKELKALIKEEELDITVKKSMTDDSSARPSPPPCPTTRRRTDDESDDDDDDDEEEDDTKEESSERRGGGRRLRQTGPSPEPSRRS